jgi:hypothetical protein
LEKLTTKVKTLETSLVREKTILNGKIKELDSIRMSIGARYSEKKTFNVKNGYGGGGSGSTPLISPEKEKVVNKS